MADVLQRIRSIVKFLSAAQAWEDHGPLKGVSKMVCGEDRQGVNYKLKNRWAQF
jgi:hypothetical protein